MHVCGWFAQILSPCSPAGCSLDGARPRPSFSPGEAVQRGLCQTDAFAGKEAPNLAQFQPRAAPALLGHLTGREKRPWSVRSHTVGKGLENRYPRFALAVGKSRMEIRSSPYAARPMTPTRSEDAGAES